MIAFTVPIRTHSKLNQRIHWAVRAKQAKAERKTTLLVLNRLPMIPISWAVEDLAVTLVRISPRFLDDDNLRGALKAVRDGVADFLGVDDRDPIVTWVYRQERGKPREYAVRVEVASR